MKGHDKPYNTIDIFETHGKQCAAEGLVSDGQPAQSDVIYDLLALITGR